MRFVDGLMPALAGKMLTSTATNSGIRLTPIAARVGCGCRAANAAAGCSCATGQLTEDAMSLRHQSQVPRMRPGIPDQPAARMRDLLRSARSRLRLRAIRAAISRATIERRPHNLWRYRELLPVEGEPHIGPQFRVYAAAAGRAARRRTRHEEALSSRTIPSTIRRCRTRIAWFRSRSARRANSASPPFHAPRPVISRPRSPLTPRAPASTASSSCPRGSRAGKDRRLDDLRRPGDHDSRQLRRRQSAVQRNRRQIRLGLRQYQPAAVLYRRRQDLRLRGRRTTRLAAARPYRAPDRRRHDPAQGRQGLQGTSRKSACCAKASSRSIAHRRPGSAPVIHALHKGTDLITPVKPDTIAKSIAIGNPADGFYVLQRGARLRRTGANRDRPRNYRRDQIARAHRRHFRRARGRHYARRRR